MNTFKNRTISNMIMTTKPLIPNKTWIVTNNREKVATLIKDKKGYTLTQGGRSFEAHDLTEIKERFGITISEEDVYPYDNSKIYPTDIYGYPVKARAYNPLWNVQRKLPIYAKSEKSKSLYCAGYYVIKFPKLWGKAFCPKLITLERYAYQGPFKTEAEARKVLNTNYNENEND